MATINSSPLRRRMIEDMTLRNLSPSTQQSYVYAVANFSRHFGQSPDKLSLEQVRAYQLHLIGLKRSWTHINQVTCALRFFYAVTLGRKEAVENIISAREPIKQPLVLSAEEVARFLEAVPALRDRVALVTAYAAGLRVGEVSRLKPSAIDSKRMLILITAGKGSKDRYVMLSPRLLSILRSYWCLAKPRHWLFPGRNPDDPVSVATLQEACRKARQHAGLDKQVTAHVLRHSFATHLYERGTDIRLIQVLLGHARLSSTERDTQVATNLIARARSPLDDLDARLRSRPE
jgi:integrase/recombinase XerD